MARGGWRRSTTPLSDLVVENPVGQEITLGSLITKMTIVQMVRYFGCLPCQEWLIELDKTRPQLAELGVDAIAIGGSADYQAKWLHSAKGVAMPLLLDPTGAVREELDVRDLTFGMLSPRGAASYLHAVANGFRLQRPTRDAFRSPGVVILDNQARAIWIFEGTRLGDYPSISSVIQKIGDLQ